jgi:hypothetical protein
LGVSLGADQRLYFEGTEQETKQWDYSPLDYIHYRWAGEAKRKWKKGWEWSGSGESVNLGTKPMTHFQV